MADHDVLKFQYHLEQNDQSASAHPQGVHEDAVSQSDIASQSGVQVAGNLSIVSPSSVPAAAAMDAGQSQAPMLEPSLAAADASGAKNVLMFSIDDMNEFVMMKSLYGSILQTPNIDKLMSMGTTFENAYATTALCNPSRTSILTGTLPTSTGVSDNSTTWYDQVNPADTLFAAFKAAGYDTAGGGKLFHDDVLPTSISSQMFDQFFIPKPTPNLPTTSDTPYTGDPSLLNDSQTAAWAANFLQTYNGTKPFMLNVGLEQSHVPWSVPTSYYNMYNPSSIPLPPHIANDLSDVPQFITEKLNTFNITTAKWQQLLQGYFAAMTYVDAQIGIVLNALQTKGELNSTAIVLWSDHGYQAGDKENWGKFTLWDTAGKAPLIMVDPGVTTPGTTVDTTVSLMDIFPTMLDIAGIPQEQGLQGTSLMPLLHDPNAVWSETAITFMYGSWSIRTDDYRYIHYADGSEELYNEQTDPNEFTNLASNSDYATIKAQMLQQGVSELASHHFVQGIDPTAAVMLGTTQSDQLSSPSPNVALKGGEGDDTYFLLSTNQKVIENANQGDDTVYVLSSYTLPANVENIRAEYYDSFGLKMLLTGNTEANQITGGPNDDMISGLDGNDNLDGFWGNDRINGGNGDDVINGDKGDDILTGGPGNDTITGGQGVNTSDYSKSPAGIAVDLAKGLAKDGYGGTDTLLQIQNIYGSEFKDNISGDGHDNTFYGFGGDDRLTGLNGNDTLIGADGNDTLVGGNGDDTLNGGLGDDVIAGGTGKDTIYTGPGHDLVIYSKVEDSTSTAFDVIVDFDAANDKLEFPTAITALDPTVKAGALHTATFDADLAAAIGGGQLAAGHAVEFTPTSGDYVGAVFLVVDANGQAGYQASADYVIEIQHLSGQLTLTDFTIPAPTT